jgi:hypothetical protein
MRCRGNARQISSSALQPRNREGHPNQFASCEIGWGIDGANENEDVRNRILQLHVK